MKKSYKTPVVEKVEFDYKEQVVASSGCNDRFIDTSWNSPGVGTCGYRFTDK